MGTHDLRNVSNGSAGEQSFTDRPAAQAYVPLEEELLRQKVSMRMEHIGAIAPFTANLSLRTA